MGGGEATASSVNERVSKSVGGRGAILFFLFFCFVMAAKKDRIPPNGNKAIILHFPYPLFLVELEFVPILCFFLCPAQSRSRGSSDL